MVNSVQTLLSHASGLIDSEEGVYGIIVAFFVAPLGLKVQISKTLSLSFKGFVLLVCSYWRKIGSEERVDCSWWSWLFGEKESVK
jgi:hypothetical protein